LKHGALRGTCRADGAEGAQRQAWALIRPDSYIAATGGQINASLVSALAVTMAATGTMEKPA
jgi:3-(3-hydroxy-phenyl)propionate hydroxylase